MVGKSDFNENPVVSLDLDLHLDFDLGFDNSYHISLKKCLNLPMGSLQKIKRVEFGN